MDSMYNCNFIIRITLICALCVFAQGSVKGQISESVIHLDKEFYVSGEIVWYSIHLPEFFNDIDRIVQVEVADDRGGIVEEHKLRTNGETSVTGYYKIPYDAPTGVYRIFFHGVHQSIGENVKLAEIEISVYNDLEKVTGELSEIKSMADNTSTLTDLIVDINMAGDAIVNEFNELSVVIRNTQGEPVTANLSVSVVDADLCNKGVVHSGDPVDYRSVQQLHEGMITKGILYSKQGDPIQVNVLGMFSPEVQRVVYTKSDDYGRFFVKVPYFTDKRQFQFLGYTAEVVDFDVEVSHELSPGPISKRVVYTPEVLEYLDLSRKRKKIYQYFTTLEHNLDAEHSALDIQELKPGVRFNMEEYEQFDNLHSFFDELMTALKFEEKNDVYTAKLENPKGRNDAQTHLTGDPLFIVDGKATRDADFIARMDLSTVKYVDLYFDPVMLRKYFSAVGRSGVIIITTRIPDSPFPEEALADIFTMNGILAPAEFPQSTTEGIPRISPQLYWNGNLETDYDGTSSIRFLQSDDISRFRVVVVAQTSDGKRGMGTLEYKLAQ